MVATGGYVFTYFHKKKIDKRAAVLDRVNLQLRNLYGPLYAELLSGEAAWESFSENYWPTHGDDVFFSENATLTDEEKENWIAWREEVFHPKNERIESIIKKSIDLVEEDGFPEVFTDLMAHVAGYKVVIRQWEKSDFSKYTSDCNFPIDGLFKMVEFQYDHLRTKQQKLINGLQKE
jgi:hypothetical protein